MGIFDMFYAAFIAKDRYLAYLNGFKMTLLISLMAVIVGVVVGVVLAIIKYSYAVTHKKALFIPKVICDIYITVIRGTPVYVQLLIIYYLILTARAIPPMVSAVICFGINSSAYVAEIIRAGIMAVDKGQSEAGRSLGLSSAATMRHIIMPQAVKNILPALGNEFIVLIKETAIVGTVTILDVTKAAQNVGSSTFEYVMPLLIAAAMYLIVVVVLTKLLTLFERRLAQSDKR